MKILQNGLSKVFNLGIGILYRLYFMVSEPDNIKRTVSDTISTIKTIQAILLLMLEGLSCIRNSELDMVFKIHTGISMILKTSASRYD